MAVRATQVQLLLYKWGEKGSQALAGAAPGGESPSLLVSKEQLDMALRALVGVPRRGSLAGWT